MTVTTNQASLLQSIGTFRTLPKEVLSTSAKDPSTQLEALVVPPSADDDDEDEPLGTEPEGGEGDGTYPNPPAPSK